tara:strand:- start:32 stop:358 length:327 start_codon:yes stop_codon:yes gene_type:complete
MWFQPAEGRSPDFNSDGFVDFDDFFLFADGFARNDLSFDLNADNTVNFLDFFLFTDHFDKPVEGESNNRANVVVTGSIGASEVAGVEITGTVAVEDTTNVEIIGTISD